MEEGSASLRAGNGPEAGRAPRDALSTPGARPAQVRRRVGTRDQNAKTAFPLRVVDITQVLEKVYFQAMRLPFHTPSAVTVTGA